MMVISVKMGNKLKGAIAKRFTILLIQSNIHKSYMLSFRNRNPYTAN